MRFLERDKTSITYKLYTGKTEVMDGTYHTGEWTETYGTPQTKRVYVSPDRGIASNEAYGIRPKSLRMIYSEDDFLSLDSIVTIDNRDYKVVERGVRFNWTAYQIREL